MDKQPFYTVTRGKIAFSVTAALGNMRKPKDWVIYPVKGDEVTIQCDTRICQFSLITGKGKLSPNVLGGAYFHHLISATEIEIPRALIEAVAESPVSGDVARYDASGKATYLQHQM